MQKNNTKAVQGCVYVLTSAACEFVKIGGTDYAPLKRIREINGCEPYRSRGPWTLHDFRQVADWRQVEYDLHYAFRAHRVRDIEGQRELFAVSPHRVARRLEAVDPALITGKPKVDRMFNDDGFARFLGQLFQVTAILNWLELQGAWTFSLFPSTGGGRYYTLNIGRHEVAYATLPSTGGLPTHMIHMDSLVRELKDVTKWAKRRGGQLQDDSYASGLGRSTLVTFDGTFEQAREFLGLPGVRRAIIAYWTEALVGLKERKSASMFARYHNWNAVAELKKRIAIGQL